MSFESPFKVLYNNAGAEVAVVSGSQMDHARPGIGLLAKDGEGAGQFLKVNEGGKLLVDADVNVSLDYSDDSVKVYGSEDKALQQSAAHGDALKVIDTDVSGAIVAMETALAGKIDEVVAIDFATEATLAQFAGDNRSDLQAVSGAIDAVGAMLEDTLTSIDGKDFATEATLAGVSGALDLFRADFAAEDFATEATLAQFAGDNRSDLQAVSGAIDAVGAMLEETLTSIDGKDFATEATLLLISSSIAQNEYVEGKLRVDADVNVQLTYDDDSVTIHGDEGLAFAQVSGSGEMITLPLGSEGFALLQAAVGSVHQDDDNAALLVGLMGSNSRNVLLSSTDDVLYVSATLNDGTISTNLDSMKTNLDNIAVIDFATEATLLLVSGAIAAAEAAIVSAVTGELDIRDLDKDTDAVTAHQGGEWTVDRVTAISASVAAVAISNANVEVIGTAEADQGASFYWNAPQGAVCYIRLGGDSASASVYTVKLVNGGYYELPERYAGKVQAIAAQGEGHLMVTKF